MKSLRHRLNKYFANPAVFFSVVILVTYLQTSLVMRALLFELGTVYPWLWTLGFMILAFNISLVFTQTLFSLFVEDPVFPEVPSNELQGIPTAILTCVKNEDEEVLERIRYTLKGNLGEDIHFWILSDSDSAYVVKEEEWVKRLRSEFGEDRIFYRARPIPFERKQGNLAEWHEKHSEEYDYLFVTDADSTIPHGTLTKLLAKAEHPENADIGIFQSAIYIVHDYSLFSRANAIGQYYAQKLYFRVNQAVFKRAIGFGHNCLIRSKVFSAMKLPVNVLSHDNWDTALADRAGYRTVFVSDTMTYEEATQNYLEERSRCKRWMKGTLQGWPILFMSKISWTTKFYIFYQCYIYLVHPVLLLWSLAGFVWSSDWSQVSLFVERSYDGLKPLLWVLFFTLGTLYGHKFFLSRSWADLKRIAFEVVVSTLVSLNNIFYISLDLFSIPFEGIVWKPMSKNPNARVSVKDCTKALIGGTVFGWLTLIGGILYSPYWVPVGFPICMSLILSIPVVYFTSKNLVWDPGYLARSRQNTSLVEA